MCSWDNVYSSYTYTWSDGREFKADGLTGNKNFIWAAGVTAVIACAMTLIDAAVLARTMRTGAARARPGEQPPKMTGIHNSSCNTGSRCVTYPSAQQTNGAPAAGVGAKTTPAADAKEETAASPKTPLFLANGRDGQANGASAATEERGADAKAGT